MGYKIQIIGLGLTVLVLILSLFTFLNESSFYIFFVISSVFIISCVMFFMPKKTGYDIK
jgi:hypothetical protein